MFQRDFNVYIMSQKSHSVSRKREICMARDGKDRLAWQEKDLCPIVGDEPDWERRGRDAWRGDWHGDLNIIHYHHQYKYHRCHCCSHYYQHHPRDYPWCLTRELVPYGDLNITIFTHCYHQHKYHWSQSFFTIILVIFIIIIILTFSLDPSLATFIWEV